MKNKIALNWVISGNGATQVVARFTTEDIPALKLVWEKTLDPSEKELAKRALQHIVNDGAVYFELQDVEYYGGNRWEKKVTHSKDSKDSISNPISP